MTASTATNRVSAPPSHSMQRAGGYTVNAYIPVGAIAQWKRQAIQKVSGFSTLERNWDGNDSGAPCMAVRQAAIGLLLGVPSESLPVPRVVPVSGGGYHFEWSVGNREVEISVYPDGSIEALKVDNGIPEEEGTHFDLASLFGWLSTR